MLPVRYTRTPAVPSFHISYKYNDCAPILILQPDTMSVPYVAVSLRYAWRYRFAAHVVLGGGYFFRADASDVGLTETSAATIHCPGWCR